MSSQVIIKLCSRIWMWGRWVIIARRLLLSGWGNVIPRLKQHSRFSKIPQKKHPKTPLGRGFFCESQTPLCNHDTQWSQISDLPETKGGVLLFVPTEVARVYQDFCARVRSFGSRGSNIGVCEDRLLREDSPLFSTLAATPGENVRF